MQMLPSSAIPDVPFPAIDLPERDVGFVPQSKESKDPNTGIVRIEADDGSVTISFGGGRKGAREKDSEFDGNLAEHLEDSELSMIAEDVIRGVEADIESRREWEETFKRGVDLLGLKLEEATSDVSSGGTVSKVYHPLLLEAVVRYQANASAELLPSAGPVKVRDDDPNSTPDRILLSEAFEKDSNHYYTAVAKEYYPDTRRLLFAQGFCGNGFKKVYRCPLRKRPVSDYVAAKDLVVSNDAVSLTNATRITHVTPMRHSVMKRLQLNGPYLDVTLGQPVSQPNSLDEKVKNVVGIAASINIPADYLYTIYESYLEYDIPGFEHKKGGEHTGLPLPYRITVDRDSKKILEIRRNWRQDDDEYMPRQRFVKYGFIPGLGFYDYGLVHLLGNTARALTAIERQLIDAGQFSNFPGVLISDAAGRQETTQIRVPPGGAQTIKTGGMPITQVVMPLPYKEPSGVLVTIAEKIAEDGRRLGMTNEVQVGEGRADVPVGTTVALIEQATKMMASVHKTNHESQQQEFELMRELFAEDPESLWKFAKKTPKRKWQIAEEFSDLELVPASDPNVPSHIHRVMNATGLAQVRKEFPGMLNDRAVCSIILSTLGYDPTSLLLPPPPPGTPAPGAPQVDPAKLAKVALEAQREQREAKTTVIDTKIRMAEHTADLANDKEERESKERIEAMRLEGEKMRDQHDIRMEHAGFVADNTHRQADRDSRERMHHHSMEVQKSNKESQQKNKKPVES